MKKLLLQRWNRPEMGRNFTCRSNVKKPTDRTGKGFELWARTEISECTETTEMLNHYTWFLSPGRGEIWTTKNKQQLIMGMEGMIFRGCNRGEPQRRSQKNSLEEWWSTFVVIGEIIICTFASFLWSIFIAGLYMETPSCWWDCDFSLIPIFFSKYRGFTHSKFYLKLVNPLALEGMLGKTLDEDYLHPRWTTCVQEEQDLAKFMTLCEGSICLMKLLTCFIHGLFLRARRYQCFP